MHCSTTNTRVITGGHLPPYQPPPPAATCGAPSDAREARSSASRVPLCLWLRLCWQPACAPQASQHVRHSAPDASRATHAHWRTRRWHPAGCSASAPATGSRPALAAPPDVAPNTGCPTPLLNRLVAGRELAGPPLVPLHIPGQQLVHAAPRAAAHIHPSRRAHSAHPGSSGSARARRSQATDYVAPSVRTRAHAGVRRHRVTGFLPRAARACARM